jgi:hypothetical protein
MSEIPPAPLPVPELSKPTVEDHVQKEPEKSQIMNALVRKELNLGFIYFICTGVHSILFTISIRIYHGVLDTINMLVYITYVSTNPKNTLWFHPMLE